MHKFILIATMLILSHFALFGQLELDYYSTHWSEVHKHELKELPKSALVIVDSIYARAKQEQNYVQLLKAMIFQAKFVTTIKENHELQIVKHFKEEITNSQPPLRNLLESMLAQIYWQYYKNHRWDVYKRTRTASKVNVDDFRTWDLHTLFEEIHVHFQRSVRNEEALQKIPLEEVDELLELREGSKQYRPTLYDFLAHNALAFYQTTESRLTEATNLYEIRDIELFDHAFILEETVPDDSLSLDYHALRLFQELMQFHASRKDTVAFLMLELDRLKFLKDHAIFTDPDELYLSSLKKLNKEFTSHPASTLIDYRLAKHWFDRGSIYDPSYNWQYQYNKKKALEQCDAALSRFPVSDGAEKCRKLKERILHPTLSLKAEGYIPINTHSRLLVRYANVQQLTFQIFRVSEIQQQQFTKPISDSSRLIMLKEFQQVATWKDSLPYLQDYQEHSTETILNPLPAGNHLILTQVPGKEEIFGYAFVQVTDLVLVENSMEKKSRFQVLHRMNGAPVEGAHVRLKTITRRTDRKSYDRTDVTDEHGFCFFEKEDEHYGGLQALVTTASDTARFSYYNLSMAHIEKKQKEEEEPLSARPFVFTDRSIYRPGQTVHFKGILTQRQGYEISVVAGEYVEVYLYDPNEEEVSFVRLKTNKFGSFSGEFKLPMGGLTGEYSISAEEDYEEDSKFYDEILDFEWNELYFSVEEYKRPRFEVTFDPIEETFRLKDSVSVSGKAMAFTGAPLSGARAVYKVTRSVRYPGWYYWSDPYRRRSSEAREISFGGSVTRQDGSFDIEFVAHPDEHVSKDELPVFEYVVSADITDINGETRSAETTVRVGYHMMQITINVPPSIRKNGQLSFLTIDAQNLNGQQQEAKGSLKVYLLKSPNRVLRERPWPAPDQQVISEDEFVRLFPHDSYGDEGSAGEPEKGELVFETEFDTGVSDSVHLPIKEDWLAGNYLVEVASKDKHDQAVTSKARFKLKDGNESEVTNNSLVFHSVDKSSYRIGGKVEFTIGSASKDVTVTIDIEKDHRVVDTRLIHISKGTQTASIPVKRSDEEGFAIFYHLVGYNSFRSGTQIIEVHEAKEELHIETATFRDKLQPGAQETWSFTIHGANKGKVDAEVLASMYDASLDQFKSHEWKINLDRRYGYWARNQNRAGNSFKDQQFMMRNMTYPSFFIPEQQFDQQDWFGFSLNNNSYIQRQYLRRLALIYYDTVRQESKVSISTDDKRKGGFIYGQVISTDGEPIPGVNVIVQGTQRGTIADINGEYSISASKGEVLEFSFIGLVSTSAEVGGGNIIDVQMAADIQQLSEVVVTALGVQKKANLTGAIVTVADEEMVLEEIEFEENPETALMGRIPGVSLTSSEGATYRVSMRGVAANQEGVNPLYVIDGVIMDAAQISEEDLASISVLKGANATALYGARAANGVILITTKSGQKKLDDELAKVRARKNLQETAFFYPHLTADRKGNIRFSFTTPEALTRWKLQLLAHTKNVSTTLKTLQTVTTKDLMIIPNAPRFLRQGDEVVIETKITNRTDKAISGIVGLQLSNPFSGEEANEKFNNLNRNKSYTIDPRGNTDVSWRISVPADMDAVQYKIVAKAGDFSDGEQNVLPILSNHMLVTETMPMQVRTGETKDFSMDKLLNNTSTTLRHHRLTLEVTSNPIWYALQALPYLMEFPYDCAEQTFARYYSNALAMHIVQQNSQIKQVFDSWAEGGQLKSHLENNEELKLIMIQETPWLRDAESEQIQKERIARLFNESQVKESLETALYKLEQMQMSSGGFPWFNGSKRPNRFITQHILSGFAHLQHLDVDFQSFKADYILKNGLKYLDGEIVKDYSELLSRSEEQTTYASRKEYLKQNHLGPLQIQYLYMHSYFHDSIVSKKAKPAFDYYKKQASTYWTGFGLYMKGMIALIMHRSGDRDIAIDIVRSLKENSITNEELGMYWKRNVDSWRWYHGPIETQSLLIETISEIEANDSILSEQEKLRTIDNMKVWLLKNKQTNRWSSTKSTTEAIYALLLKGSDWLSVTEQVEMAIGGEKLEPEQLPEHGTGYFKASWSAKDFDTTMGKVSMTKKGKGIAWGGLYWQYFEDLDKITVAETPLKLKKMIFKVNNTATGEVLEEVTDSDRLEVGDLVRVRIELSVDRAMEYVHMKDMRAAGMEPVSVLSEYKWQDGLGYYESTRDASTNFFFDDLPKGVYVFEYDLRVNNSGHFSNGITTIQSMYAPEFSSHSEGIKVIVE